MEHITMLQQVAISSEVERTTKIVKPTAKDVSSSSNNSAVATKSVHQEQEGQSKINEPHEVRTPGEKSKSLRRFMSPVKRIASRLWLWPKQRCKGSIGDERKRRPKLTLSSLFFTFPVELQLEVISNLPINDLLHLRQTSRQFRHLILDHESYIAKRYMKQWMPKYITILFPLPTTAPPTLDFIDHVSYRIEQSDELADLFAHRIVKEMGGSRRARRTVDPKIMAFVIDQLRARFCPLILAIFHFLETYYYQKQKLHETGYLSPGVLLQREQHIQSDIIRQYPDCLLLKIHQMYHLMLHLFTRRLTEPPWYLSRPIGPWNHTATGGSRPSEESFAKVLVMGGVPEIVNFYRIKGQSKRTKAFNKLLKTMDVGIPEYGGLFVRHGKAVKSSPEINIDQLANIWVPAAERQLLSRGIVSDLDSIRCCGEFVAELLGDEFNSVDEGSVLGDFENADITPEQSAEIRAHMHTGGVTNLRLDDDGNWDQNLIVEGGEDVDEAFGEEVEGKDKEGSGIKRPSTPPAKPVAGPSRSPGTIVGMTAPVPGTSGSGYNGMGANFMSMTL